jgi:hypothetical protein
MKITLLFSEKNCFTFLLLLVCFLGFSQSQTFNNPADNGTAANTFTVPAGVNSITIEAWGAGGRGGSAIQNGVSNAGGGGGGGAYSKKTIPVTSGATYNLIVGSGGNDVTLNGGNSSFNTNITVARGGIGVTTNNLSGGNGGNWVTGDGDYGYSGGNGSSGIAASYGGGGGSSAGTGSIGTNGSNSNGGIITIGGGNGGNGSTTNGNNPGLAGNVPGGGGGGATKGTGNAAPVGGSGGDGQVIISWTSCTPPSIANAGPDQTLASCVTTTTLSGNNPTVGAGTWSVVSGTATITNPSLRTSGVTGLTLGASATLRWTIANAPCSDSIDDVVITTATGATCLSYCNPTYTNGPGTVDQITNITLGTLNNTTGPSATPYYTFYNSLPKPNLLQSSTASISISFGSDGNQYAAVWIDFNQDGTFQSGEGVISGNAGANGTIVINIPIPAGAVLGNTRMRVRGGDDFALATSQACNASNSTWGETEDYIVNITAAGLPTITSLATTSGCIGGNITINGTNLTGATAANLGIGGTAVSSITSNSGTQIIAVIGAGTTGTVNITTAGGTATSTATFTVNSVPNQPSVITGNASPCSGSSQNYSVTNVSGVTYNWTFPSGWTQTAGGTTNSITVTTNGNSGNVTATPSNGCGNGTAITLAVTSTSVPSQPSTISGNSMACISSSQVYSVINVAGTTYNWVLPTGWIQTAGGTTNSITVSPSLTATNGNISVTPANACGNGTAITLAVTTISSVPAQSSTITGNTAICSGTSQTYSVTNVTGVTYTWTFPSGWIQTAGGTTNSITVTTGTTSGNIQVTPSNSCGNGTARTLAVTATTTPTITSTTPGSRTGIGTVTLSATASGGTISWYANLTGGSALGTGNNFTTPGIITTTTYYVDTYNGLCGSSPRIAVVATVNFPEISVSGNGFNIADEDITPITTDFTNLGTANMGFNLARTYTIQNSGTVDLSIGTISIGGVNSSEFVVTTPPSATIIPGGSTTFTITFTPTAIGIRNANVSFVTNDPDENPFNFDIAGTGGSGVIPEINIQGSGITIIDGDSGPTTADGTDFGSLTIPATRTRTFTIQNTGTGPLLLTGTPIVVVTGSSNFVVTAQPSSNTIPAGGNLTFQITFNPTVTGSSVALVSINNNDSDESIYDFAITGAAVVTGVEIDIQGNEISIVDGDITPRVADQTDFGITDSVTPIPLTYNVYSFGLSTLNINATVAITGPNASQFTAPNIIASGTSLASGAVTSFVITFTPTASLGIKTATVTITSNDPDEGTYNFDISAEVQTLAPLTVAPGGITSNLKFWLKANSSIGTVTDNTTITTWPDQTYGSTKNAVAPFSKEPKFQNNPSYNVNFNPVIHFNGNNTMSGGQGFNNSDMFIVVKPTNQVSFTSSPQDIYSGDDTATNKGSQDVTGFQMGNTSARHNNDVIAYNQGAESTFGIAENSTTKSYSGVNIFNPRKSATFPTVKMEILNNGNTLTTSSVLTGSYKDIVNTRYWLGRSEFFDASFDGDILEVINYNTRNSDADKSKIETYLAIKYGITLGINGTSQNYINSAGTTIYAAGSGFNYNIAGIGRDDKSLLNQKQSKTENSNNDITIGLGNIFDKNSDNTNTFNDKDFLVWGNNNNTLTAQSPIVVDMSTATIPALSTPVDFISIGRTWKVIETGVNVPSVKISIPSVMLTATITPPGDFLMFISDSPVFNPTAEYRIMKENGSNLETNYDFNGTKYITFGYAPERTFIRSIDFDGVNDYLDAGKVLDLNTSFTVSAWIKRSATNQTILSKRNNPFTEGYDLSINSSQKAEMSWFNGTKQTITSVTSIPAEKWHHIGIIFNGTTAKLYIDGVLDTSKTMATVPANTQSFLIAAANGESPTSFFNGTIDEVRVWNVDLSEQQLRYVMNQEISRNASFIGGNIVPNTISLNEVGTIPWTNLSAYYPMSTYTFTNAKDISSNNYTAALKNITTVDWQTAPLPYESELNGNWETAATWKNNTVQDLPYSLSIVNNTTLIDWNIVKTNNNISSVGNKTLLGLFVNSNTLTVTSASGLQTDGTKIEVSHYLKLDGKIDLVGRSQLVQKLNSDLDPTSSGSLERDQQGQSNKFNYNYWGSPVGAINASTNNNNFTVGGVLKDGTNPLSLANINWVTGYDGSPTTPISLAKYWIYKFDNAANLYANWNQIFDTGTVPVGQGFTLKGSGAATATQNLTFVGKPNNGTITRTVGATQLLLVGNPYSSALDANAFITDNSGSIDTTTPTATDGALYFWEHYPGNNTHNLGGYQGGYAVRNAAAGVPPSSSGVDFISTSGVSTRVAPNRYIPVGQGFFVIGNGSGGTVTFKNSQRAFIKEDDPASQVMYRIPTKPKGLDHWTDNSNDLVAKDSYKKVRLGFNNYNEIFHRQVVVAFMDDKANSEINEGYDAENIDDVDNDMYLLNSDKELIIEGEGYFDENASYPIGVRSDTIGKVSFVLDGLENFDKNQSIFIYDKSDDTYHNINGALYEVELPAGTIEDRFALRFTDKTLGTNTSNLSKSDEVNVIVNQNVTVQSSNQLIKNIAVYDLSGRKIDSYKKVNALKYTLSHLNKTTAGLIVKITLEDDNIVSKKIIY